MDEEIIINCDNVKYAYAGSEDVNALNGVSLSVKRGEFLSLIGHNGSGKSTLARLFNGLITADSGTVNVFGLDLSNEDNIPEVRRKVGIVFQNPDNQMVASIVEDDVAFGPENIGIERKEIGERIEWSLDAVGMSEYRHSQPSKLSGGQKQRIAIAGVLAIKPEVLVLDESTAMLDPKGRREVMEVVKKLNKEEGMTVILITHFMEEALLADRTVVLNRGEKVLEGTPEEIFKNSEYLQTFNLAMPKISIIADKLRSVGMNISNVLRSEELASEIKENLLSRGICAAQSSKCTVNEVESKGNWDIVIENLSFTYSPSSPFSTNALKGVNLEIKDGEFFGIIGHTGSGKSTLVQHLNALIKLPQATRKYKKPKVKKGEKPPVEPSIKIGEFNLADRKCDFMGLRTNVGMVFQYPEYQLFAETVFDDVAFGLKNFNKKIEKDEIERAVRESLEIVGLDFEEVKDKSPFDLSGGQKRRVAIAGVIVTKPKILILDEPAAGLDPLGKVEIMELLHRIHENWCDTVIIVSHDMDEIAENCTRAAVISDGVVFDEDVPSKLFKNREQLLALGLDIPLTEKIGLQLAKSNIIIDDDCTLNGFADKVIEVYMGGNYA